MKKSKGSALLISILCIMMMLLIASILIQLSYIGFQTVIATTKAERLRTAAESGIEKAIQVLKDREGSVPVYPGNVLTYSSPDGELKYVVEIYKKDKQPPYEDMFYITSKVSTSDDKYYKSYVVRISKESFKSNFFIESLCSRGLTVLGQEGSSFENKENTTVSFKTPIYLQCDNISIKQGTMTNYTTIAIKAESMAMDFQPYDKYIVYADIPENNLDELNSLYGDYVRKCSLNYYDRILLKSGLSEDMLLSENLFLIKRLDGSNISLRNIDNTWRNAKNNMALTSAAVDASVWQKLNPDSMKQLSDYIRENTTYKLIIIKGGLEIPDGEYNNYIICCSGNISVSGNVRLNNSSLLCTGFNMKEGTSLSITGPLQSAMESSKKKISSALKSWMSNYSDGTTVKFISWYDL